MYALRHHEFTVEDYFEHELSSRARHEFYDGAILVMSGASTRHVTITGNTFVALHRRVGRACRAFVSEQRIVTGDDLYTYPDVLVACGALDFYKVQGTGTLRNPSLLVEVLSPSTRSYDLGEKLAHYQTIASLKEVIFIEQDIVDVLHLRRAASGWEQERFVTLTDVIPLRTLRRGLPLSEVYARAFEL